MALMAGFALFSYLAGLKALDRGQLPARRQWHAPIQLPFRRPAACAGQGFAARGQRRPAPGDGRRLVPEASARPTEPDGEARSTPEPIRL